MKYIVCEKPGSFKLLEKESPKKLPGEALLKVSKVGICGTDLHAYTGKQAFFTYPRILGHELAATVLEIDKNVHDIKAGDAVVVMPYISCGTCVACTNAKSNCCTQMQVLGVHTDGGMQEIISVPDGLLLPAPNLSAKEMALVEPLAIGAHAIRRAQIQKGETVVVIGAGPIGIGILKLAMLAGAKVIAVDTNPARLEFADKNGIADFIVLAGDSAMETIQKITNGDLATVVFDASGNKKAIEAAPNFMSHGGRLVLVGLSKEIISFNHPAIHAKEISLLCSRNATQEDFLYVMKILEHDDFPVEKFITHTVTMPNMIANFDAWLDPGSGVIKAMVEL